MNRSIAQGKIFLADQRGLSQSSAFKRFSTFNFGDFTHPAKTAIHSLYLFNDDMLAGGQQTTYQIDRDSHVIILPITGAVNFEDGQGNETDIDVEEALVVFVPSGTSIQLSNPFKKEVINYLCICLAASDMEPIRPQFFSFDLTSTGKLIQINKNSLPFTISIGRFDGRTEATCPLDPANCFYAFAITGAFEIDGRLLHERDGLALWGTNSIAIEALSNNAVVFTIAFP